jgi:hypothetical protein
MYAIQSAGIFIGYMLFASFTSANPGDRPNQPGTQAIFLQYPYP